MVIEDVREFQAEYPNSKLLCYSCQDKPFFKGCREIQSGNTVKCKYRKEKKTLDQLGMKEAKQGSFVERNFKNAAEVSKNSGGSD